MIKDFHFPWFTLSHLCLSNMVVRWGEDGGANVDADVGGSGGGGGGGANFGLRGNCLMHGCRPKRYQFARCEENVCCCCGLR